MAKKQSKSIIKSTKSWNQLTNSTHSKLGNVAKKLYDSGITAKDVLAKDKSGNFIIDDRQLKQLVGIKSKKVKEPAQKFRENVKSLSGNLDRKEGTRKEVIPKFKAFTGNRMTKQTNRLLTQFSKTIGLNTFFDISREVQKQYSNDKYKMTEKESWSKTRDIIKQYNLDKKKLSSKDTAIFNYFY